MTGKIGRDRDPDGDHRSRPDHCWARRACQLQGVGADLSKWRSNHVTMSRPRILTAARRLPPIQAHVPSRRPRAIGIRQLPGVNGSTRPATISHFAGVSSQSKRFSAICRAPLLFAEHTIVKANPSTGTNPGRPCISKDFRPFVASCLVASPRVKNSVRSVPNIRTNGLFGDPCARYSIFTPNTPWAALWARCDSSGRQSPAHRC